MLREAFLSRHPSHFQINPVVRAFILAEMFLWSGWNFFFPLIGVFVIEEVGGADLKVVATAYSLYMVSRVGFELLSAKKFGRAKDTTRLAITIVGGLIIGFGYLSFLVASSVFLLFLTYILIGAGIGISSPTKLSLFSMHLDKNKEATEWSFYDALSFGGMAISGVLGGVIASKFGFDVIFIGAAFLNFLGVLPYFFLLGRYSRTQA